MVKTRYIKPPLNEDRMSFDPVSCDIQKGAIILTIMEASILRNTSVSIVPTIRDYALQPLITECFSTYKQFWRLLSLTTITTISRL